MLVSFQNVCFGYAGEPLLDGVSFTLHEQTRAGLIGGNGEGKTTLIKLILSELSPESGSVEKRNGLRVGYLPQNGGFESDNAVYDEMLEVFREDARRLERLREIEKSISLCAEGSAEFTALAAKYDALNKQIAARDGYNFEVKIKTVLNGMGFQNVYQQKISTMSGGEKTRLKLCRLLLEEPELLILDEPTNHLDMKTLFWLEEYLTAFKGALVIVSHDRYFLDRTVKEIHEIENKKLCVFKGNYSKYKVLKAERTAFLLKEYEKQQEERARLQEYVDKNLARASTTKSAQSRRNKLEKMELIEKPKLPPAPPRFEFSYLEKPYEKVLEVLHLQLSAGEKALLNDASFTVLRGEKCAVVGDNGTGKSTLIKELVKGKNPAVKLGRFVKIAYYDQENANLAPNNTVLEELWGRHVTWEQTNVRAILAQAGLPAEDMDKKISTLSGGERAKLAMAVFECERGNFLLLDEPTNHLDLPARESLEEALKSFDGTLMFVSHDRYFIRAIAGKIIELSNNQLTEFTGNYDEYTAFKAVQAQKESLSIQAEKTLERVPTPTPTQTGYRSKEERAADAKKRERIKKIEKEIAELEQEEELINASLSDPKIAGNFALLQKQCTRLEQIKKRTDQLYEEYETLI